MSDKLPEVPYVRCGTKSIYQLRQLRRGGDGARTANPGRIVEIVNVTGLACLDSSKGSSGCGGPEGAIAIRTEGGLTHFSVREESGQYSDNQAFFEFDVRLK